MKVGSTTFHTEPGDIAVAAVEGVRNQYTRVPLIRERHVGEQRHTPLEIRGSGDRHSGLGR